ncbi:ABC-type transporter Mla maintaining outer membrane lipid asymmetry, ATPase component MlaF [Neorhodopirellula lusitana]|uniref:ABC-type transporter Mla maintaining outer membrane lipid asymmetry, ATPase component MlaF n=1 Tax=Neorhodopirellula lusitana TaxID=445327 RepID=A0ABY1PRE0_9BACT|nr:ATP-binding cassette domain-containing protein [Neorhodopirellula lusitana]SMP38487.1 ABC-type transporter Mla maintaining outer membrane lipid asymmetry, ATPase component MlaF [Neorhodopirellula lusitana]
MLSLSKLSVTAGNQTLLQDVSATIADGKITVLVGPSGAGKSVLLKVLAGLLPRDGEAIQWSGNLRSGDPEKTTDSGGRTGIVFQQFALFDELTPTANVQFAIDHRSDSGQPAQYSADQWLDLLGVPSLVPVAALSGGQKQRLAIARTLAADPDIILYDEPTSGLDAASGYKVAELIRDTQQRFQRTSLVVTHDYATLLGIADDVLLLDPITKSLVSVPVDQREAIPERMRAAAIAVSDSNPNVIESAIPASRLHRVQEAVRSTASRFFAATGSAVVATVRLPVDTLPIVPRPRWAFRFFLHYLRLVGGPSACVYLVIAGLIAGFTTTYFTLRFLPFRLYTQPLLIDEMLASIGFALYRILVPVLATILIAARCGAAVAADVGVKQYGGQIEAIKTFGIRQAAYLLVPIMAAFLIATPVLEWLAFTSANWVSRVTFLVSYPDIGIHFWHQHFFRAIEVPSTSWAANLPSWGMFVVGKGWGWVLLKNSLCAIGTAAIAYHQGITRKSSASDVSHAITATVLWTTLYVLNVHFVIALLEF